jgi:acyl-coenzyme A synthetase/AMP-(fatty) acid ligase
MDQCSDVKTCVVVNRIDQETDMKEGWDHWWHELMADASHKCDAEPMDSEDPLFILYTSGSTKAQRCASYNGGIPPLHLNNTQILL